MIRPITVVCLLAAVLWCTVAANNPYDVLGVSHQASDEEIKKSYKRLAKEWHPDRNQAENAQERFMEIQEAYNLLSDSQRRSLFDRTGSMAEEGEMHYQRDRNMDDLLRNMMRDHFGGRADHPSLKSLNARRVTQRMYDDSILHRSHTQPQMVFVYDNMCRECMQWADVWNALVDDMQQIGYGMLTVNRMMDGNLASTLRARNLPALLVLVDGRALHYRGNLYDTKEIIRFARQAIHPSHVTVIDQTAHLMKFVDQWPSSNKVSVIMIGQKKDPRIRYLLSAMRHAQHARFAYIGLNSIDDAPLLKSILDIDDNAHESIMVFNDMPEKGPFARLSSTGLISADAINNLVENNRYLILPRLSSQLHFDHLCPVGGDPRFARNVHICCILVVNDINVDEDRHDVDLLRTFIADNAGHGHGQIDPQRVRFVYTETKKQPAFVNGLDVRVDGDTKADNNGSRDMAIVWRVSDTRARFTWLRGVWSDDASASFTLTDKIDALLTGRDKLTQEAALTHLIDEHGPSFFGQFSHRSMRAWETIMYRFGQDELLPAASAIGTLAFIIVVGYLLNYAAGKEEIERKAEEARLKRAEAQRKRQQGIKTEKYDDILRELRGESFDGMVRNGKPGCRTVVVLVSQSTKQTILPTFRRAVWPWRNNKTLTFGYVIVEKNINWFKKLLAYTLPVNEDDPDTAQFEAFHKKLATVNPINTVGTVLSLNPWRYYFCMYHPMHAPSMVGYKPRATKSSNFLGFDSDSEEDDDKPRRNLAKESTPTPEDVLSGLPNWLDRLFEGQMKRYCVPDWGEMR